MTFALITTAKTTYSSSAINPRTTPAFNCLAGDLVVVGSVVENGTPNYAATPVTNNGAALTWQQHQTVDISTNQTMIGLWSTTIDADRTGMTVTLSLTAAQIQDLIIWVYRDAVVGASNKADNGVGTGAPSLILTTQGDNSQIVGVNADWTASAGARTYVQVNGLSPTEDLYVGTVGADYIGHGFHYTDSGAAGAKTLGISSPSAQRYTIAALEIKPATLPAAVGPQVRSSASYVTTVNPDTTATVPLPSGWRQNDLCYISWSLAATAAALTVPSGWAEVFSPILGSGSTNALHGVMRRILQDGDADPVLNFVAGRLAAVSVAIYDYDPITPEDVAGVTDNNVGLADPSVRAPALTTITPNCLLITSHAVRNQVGGIVTAFTPPASMTEINDVSSAIAGQFNPAVEVCTLALPTAGATSVQTATATGTDVTTLNQMGSSIAVRPYVPDLEHLLLETGYALLQETRHHLLLEA